MRDIIEKVDIGYSIPNIKKAVNVIAKVIGLSHKVYVMPLRIKKLDNHSYIVVQQKKIIIFVGVSILAADRLSSAVLRLLIHELYHCRQIANGDLSYNNTMTVAIWMGKEYTSDIRHEDREWEQQARDAERQYITAVKKKIKYED